MLYTVEKQVGHPTPELRNYLIKNPNSAEYYKMMKQVRTKNDLHQEEQPREVKAYDKRYHRGAIAEMAPVVSDPSINQD